jgi:hypothetical protein
MSYVRIKVPRYKCICDLEDCMGRTAEFPRGQPWITEKDELSERCPHCGRRTWNGVDKRASNPWNQRGSKKADRPKQAVKTAVRLPKPKKVRSIQ